MGRVVVMHKDVSRRPLNAHALQLVCSPAICDLATPAPAEVSDALKRLETEGPLLGFDACMDNEELFYDVAANELLELLIDQGLMFDGKIHGFEQQLMSLGYYQLFFLAQLKNVPVIETPMVIGNFLVTLSRVSIKVNKE